MQKQRSTCQWHFALNLSKIAQVDYRDAYGSIAKLSFAAQQCGVDLEQYALEICRETPAVLMGFMKKPGPVKVGSDAEGNLEFQVSDETLALRARHKEFIEVSRKNGAALKAKPASQ